MVTLDQLLDAGDEQRERTHQAGRVAAGYLRVGLWGTGWLLARLLVLVLALLAGLFYGAGWVAARTAPALVWARAAFTLGWQAGRARGPA